MIQFNEFELPNGLKIIVNEDKNTSLAVVNLLYNVGSRDENPNKTGFAHLFEHFMFEGSANIPEFDTPLQKAGGVSNAFTSPDLTNYYEILPATNIETAFWLESDRMLQLAFNQKKLDTQINVVCEEFKENYLNKPYGDIWHKLMNLSYDIHSYNWPTIGKQLEHIQAFTMQEVEEFFRKYYCPNNAILCVSGNIKTSDIEKMARKWFGEIPKSEEFKKNIPVEPKQTKEKISHVKANVPISTIYKAYHMSERINQDYYSEDLLSDVLGYGNSSRLYENLVKQQSLFSNISAFVTGSIDPGLLVIEGKVQENVSLQDANLAIEKELEILQKNKIQDRELQKVKNKSQSSREKENIDLMSRAYELAYYKNLGNIHLINDVNEHYEEVTNNKIQEKANTILRKTNCSTLLYEKK